MSFENENESRSAYDYDDVPNQGYDSEDISIQIKKDNNDLLYYEINTKDTIKSLIERYKVDNGTQHGTNVRLSLKGKMLDENKTFKDYNVQSDDTLDICIRLPGGIYKKI